jgi:hypothetical protein
MHERRHGIGRGALRIVTLAVLGLVLGPGLGIPAHAATRGFTITSFDAIRVEAPITVMVTTGIGPSARADGDQTTLDRLRVDVSGRVLKVTMDRIDGGGKSSGAATLRLSTGDLSRIVLIGGGSVTINRLRGQRADIALGGSGNVRIAETELDQLDLMVAGAGRAILAGQAGMAMVRVSGPGAVDAAGLHVRHATVGNDGPGSVALTADVTAKVAASGSGDVMVTGEAACTVDNHGTGRVSCGGGEY